MIRFDTKITKTIDHSADVLKAIYELNTNQVMVGVPAAKAPRDAEEANGSPINNAALAYIHNYGAPSVNIPPRPFMEPGIKNVQGKINEKMEKTAADAFDGKRDAVAKGLTAAGIVAVIGIKAKIMSGPFAPLKPATLAARRRRGHKGTRILVETAQMRDSMNFVLRKK